MNNRDIRTYIDRGKSLRQLHDYDEACKALKTAIYYAHEPRYVQSRTDAYRELCIVQIALKNYKEALDAYEEMKKLDQKRDVRLDDIPINQRVARIENHVKVGNTLLERGDYEGALEHFQSALYFAPYEELEEGTQRTKTYYRTRFTEEDRRYLNTKLVYVYSGKGHAEYALRHLDAAIKSYAEAIDLGTKDSRCFIRIGEYLFEDGAYERALDYYHQATLYKPDDLIVQFRVIEICFRLKDYAASRNEYQKARKIFLRKRAEGRIGAEEYLKLLLIAGDIYTSQHDRKNALDTYERAFTYIKNKDLCLLAWNFPSLSRPASAWLHLSKFVCQYAVNQNTFDEQATYLLKQLADLYPDLFDPLCISKEEMDIHITVLQEIFELLPVNRREEALNIIAQHDEGRVAHLLTCLASARLSGFTTLVEDAMAAWQKLVVNKDLVYQFYRVLPGYAIPQEQADLFLARCLLGWGEYKQVQAVLTQHIQKSQPQSDSLWYISLAMQQLEQDPEQQVALLRRFIALFSDDTRVVDAYKRIGDLCWERLHDGPGALAAYRDAAKRGVTIPRLNLFRLGNWENEILHALPDYSFPPMVVIDIESEYDPDAAPGSLVFEVAAVRVKGNTELDAYQAVIQREFVAPKVAKRQGEAKPQEIVTRELQAFINATSTPQRPTIIVGHNLRSFDARHLRAMGITIPEEQIIDTLELARLLYPDSLHHHLALLCDVHGIVTQGDYHHALPDAQACGRLLHVLGDEFIRRGARLLNGVRALVPPDSVFDRTILQPRRVPADPTIAWKLDPAPVLSQVITPMRGNQASTAMQSALQSDGDFFVEHTDFDANYSQFLPFQERSLVAVSSRTRIERMLAGCVQQDVFILPHPQTLLCSESVQQSIEASSDAEERLMLFCLYQAAHNHDADTLYALRLPEEALDDPRLLLLRQKLIAACCSNAPEHDRDCPARQAVQSALGTHRILVSTHKNLLTRQTPVPNADSVVIDDIADLQMHLAEQSANPVTSVICKNWFISQKEQRAYAKLEAEIVTFIHAYVPEPGYRERLPLASFVAHLGQHVPGGSHALLQDLRKASKRGEQIANILQTYFTKAEQKPASPAYFHGYWIEVWFAGGEESGTKLERWEISGLSEDLCALFLQRCWEPYKKHILAGSALTTGGRNMQFLQRCLGIPRPLPLKQDPRTKKRVLLPSPELLSPAGFLRRRKWIMDIGHLLVDRLQESQRVIMVTLNNATTVDALLTTFCKTCSTGRRQLLASQLNWTVTKINERMCDPERRLLVFASPRLRQTLLASPSDLEISGPLRFLNRRDPVVAAQMRVFAHLYPQEGPFSAYLLPQALLELRARLSSDAKEYLICDSSLLSKIYRDEVLHMLNDAAEIQELSSTNRPVPTPFSEVLHRELVRRGLDNQSAFSDAELYQVLRTIWDTDTFRPFVPQEETAKPPVTQKEVVQAALEKKDQLVVAATGGGKSLCFQLPALLLAEEAVPRVTLIFSPLIALMSDQIEQLKQKGIFSAITLNSTLSPEQRQEHLAGLKKGVYSIVYLAPEQIYSAKLNDALQHREIGLIAIDEAHCVSQWGHNFRTDYFMLKKWIKKTLGKNQKREFPLLALTATARKGYKDTRNEERSDRASTVEDIIENLELVLGEDQLVLSSALRRELAFRFEYIAPTYPCPECKLHYEYHPEKRACPQCGYKLVVQRRELEQDVLELKKRRLLALLSPDAKLKDGRLPDLYPRWSRPMGERQRGLIYCAYQKTTEEIATYLQNNIPKLRVSAYHAGMETTERKEILQRFTSDTDEGLDVVVSTNAFGMGIDVRRLGFVIHFETPATPEAYYQEAGRAGRDSFFKEGKEHAECVLLFHPSDLEKQRLLSRKNTFSDYEIEDVYKAICQMYEWNREHLSGQERILDPLLPFSLAPDEMHLLASVQDIATRAGVEEDQVKTLLYYLEEHTTDTVKKGRLLERGTVAQNVWQLKFEKDYLTRIGNLPENSQSCQLLKVFQSADGYQLSTAYFTTISAHELKDTLRMSLKSLEQELLNLVKRGMVAYEGHGQFKLNVPVESLHTQLTSLGNDMKKLLKEIDKPPRKRLTRNEIVTVNIGAMVSRLKLNTVTMAQLTHFLFLSSLEVAEPLRLLERFKRVIRNGQPDTYELQLWSGCNKDIDEAVDKIIVQLRQTVDTLALQIADQGDEHDRHVIDVFALGFDYDQRRNFHRQLQLLDALGFLKYTSDPALGQAMHIKLLQPPVPLEQFEIDLHALRLQERHANSKRKLMERYATNMQKEQYAEQFAQYFQGEQPLIEHSQHAPRQELNEQQRAIVELKEGIHIVKGPAGCGKTTTLAEHVKYLVNHHVPIDHIMITTYYKSAEGHIAEALKELEGEGETAVCTTINAFGAKIFQQFRHLLMKPDRKPYYSEPPKLLKEEEREDVQYSAINEALKRCATRNFTHLIAHCGWPWPRNLHIPQFGSTYRSNAADEGSFLVAIHKLRQYGVFPTQPPDKEELERMIGKQTGTYSLAEFYAVFVIFAQVIAEQNRWTFDDQVVFALAILRANPSVAHEYQRYFEHIIIDELQDFSPAKLELLMLLCERRKNILAFGDLSQEIGFDKIKSKENGRQSDAHISAGTVFSRLSKQESCGTNRPHELTINYRSTQEMLDLCSYLRTDSRNPVLRSAENRHGPKPVYLYTSTNALRDLLEEALRQIEQLAPVEKESIALIFGGNDLLHNAQKELGKRKVPFSLMDGQKTVYQLHYVRNVLLYLYLIMDKKRDEEIERLLRYNIVPYFDRAQINSLKDSANKRAISLWEVISSPRSLQDAKIGKGQQESLQDHLELLNNLRPSDLVAQLEQHLYELQDGPLTLLQDQEEKRMPVEEILSEFRQKTIAEAVEEIGRHLLFLDTHRDRSDLVLSTVTYAKSQEFETVFLFGVGQIYEKRLYVSVSRAKQRLFLVGDRAAFLGNNSLSHAPNDLYKEVDATKIGVVNETRG